MSSGVFLNHIREIIKQLSLKKFTERSLTISSTWFIFQKYYRYLQFLLILNCFNSFYFALFILSGKFGSFSLMRDTIYDNKSHNISLLSRFPLSTVFDFAAAAGFALPVPLRGLPLFLPVVTLLVFGLETFGFAFFPRPTSFFLLLVSTAEIKSDVSGSEA